MSELSQLIYNRQMEYIALNESLGTDFPAVEDNKRRRMAYLEMLIEDLRSLKDEQPPLNDNQQIVMDWLKENYNHKYSKRREVFWALSMFTTNSMYEDFSKESVGIAYSKLDNQQFAHVLEAFSKWAQE